MIVRPSSTSALITPLFLSVAVLPLAGCGGARVPSEEKTLHPVSGRVTVGGKPAEGVEVRFHPLNRFFDAEAPHPFATTEKDGRFRLRMGPEREGAPNGQYVATLAWPSGRGGADRLGGAFAEPDGSGLTVVIEDGTTELPPIEVNSSSRKAGSR